ncbi:hypothetical protein HFD88_009759 [Aspergillus terreus]|nr:hypothetical protein HFD88_009759 [Aspergillus terreus]
MISNSEDNDFQSGEYHQSYPGHQPGIMCTCVTSTWRRKCKWTEDKVKEELGPELLKQFTVLKFIQNGTSVSNARNQDVAAVEFRIFARSKDRTLCLWARLGRQSACLWVELFLEDQAINVVTAMPAFSSIMTTNGTGCAGFLTVAMIRELLGFEEDKGKPIDQFEMPNIRAVHFLLHDHLDRGYDACSTDVTLGKNCLD